MSDAKRTFFRITRTLHIYLTMLSSIVLFLFALTGLMLNHKGLFGLQEGGRRPQPTQPGAGPGQDDRPDPRSEPPRGDSAKGDSSKGDAAKGESAKGDSAKGPGAKGGEPPQAPRGFLAKLTSLHKGKPSTIPVVLFIDVTAILLMLGSVTGIALLLSLPNRRRLGLVAMGIGTVAAVVVFVMLGL